MPLSISPDVTRRLRLAGQRLIAQERTTADDIANVVKAVGGIQAQEWPAAQLSIRARSQGLTAADIQQAKDQARSVVRGWYMRGTLHLVAAEDDRWLRPLLAPDLIRQAQRRRTELGLDEVKAANGVKEMAEVLGQYGPLTRAELVDQLAQRGIQLIGQAAPYLIHLAVMRGIARYGPDREKEPTFILSVEGNGEGEALPAEEARQRLAHRYLAAYGPARPEDLAAWSGFSSSETRAAWQGLTGELLEVRIEGEPAWMLKEQAAWLDESPPAAPAVRLLPRYDTYLLGYKNRNLAVAPEHARRVHPGGGVIHATVLVNGQAAGNWRTERRKENLIVIVEPFGEVTAEVKELLEQEAKDVGRFLGMDGVLRLAAVS